MTVTDSMACSLAASHCVCVYISVVYTLFTETGSPTCNVQYTTYQLCVVFVFCAEAHQARQEQTGEIERQREEGEGDLCMY